jgi:hypothetical protein
MHHKGDVHLVHNALKMHKQRHFFDIFSRLLRASWGYYHQTPPQPLGGKVPD